MLCYTATLVIADCQQHARPLYASAEPRSCSRNSDAICFCISSISVTSVSCDRKLCTAQPSSSCICVVSWKTVRMSTCYSCSHLESLACWKSNCNISCVSCFHLTTETPGLYRGFFTVSAL